MRMKNRKIIMFLPIIGLLFLNDAFPDIIQYEHCLKKGWDARKNKSFVEAEKAYRCALRENPESEDAEVGLLYTLIEKGDNTKAVILSERLVKKYPENVWIQKGSALAYYNKKQYLKAAGQYRKILKTNIGDDETRLNLGISLLKGGLTESAEYECRKIAAEHSNDIRYKLCIGETLQEWKLKPQLYYTYINYDGAWDVKESNALTVGFEASHISGVGFLFDISYSWYEVEYDSTNGPFLPLPGFTPKTEQTSDYWQITPGFSLYYWTPDYFLWSRYSLIISNTSEGVSHVFSLYGNVTPADFILGVHLDLGVYDGYTTLQTGPEAGIYIGDRFTLKAAPMIQHCFGNELSTGIESKTRYSFELSLEGRFSFMTFYGSVYYGSRWYTVEDHGLFILNSDEEYRWGGKVRLLLFPENMMSPYVSFRIDKAVQQYGSDHSFLSTGITAGLQCNF